MEYQMRNWYYFVWLCGDHICEQHIHNLDVMNWVKQGHPVRAHGMGGVEVRKGPDYGEIFDHHAVEFEYADGSRCFSQCRHINGCWDSVSEHAVGTKGSVDISGYTIRGENAWRFKGGGKALGASARAPEHIPKCICEERATTPPPKRHAALRVALKWAWGFVAQSVEYRCVYTPSLAPRPRPISAQRMYSYFGDTTLAG